MNITYTTYDNRTVEYFSTTTIKQKSLKEAKFARVAVLAKTWTNVESKLISLVKEKNSQEAYACLVLAMTGIRIGNEDSAEGYVTKVKGKEGQTVQTFGLSTLKKEHVTFTETSMHLDFVGKKVVDQNIRVDNPFLIEYGKKFYDSNTGDKWLNIDVSSLIKFVRTKIDKRLTIKDFRTFAANCKAYLVYVDEIGDKNIPANAKELKEEIKHILIKTSDFLGNTPGICKSAYVSHHLLSWIESKRNENILKIEAEKKQKAIDREIAWKKMNEERVAKGLKPLYKKVKKKPVKKVTKGDNNVTN